MSATLTIVCNNVPRDVVDAFELTAAEREEFDYLDWQALEEGTDSASFVRYKGELIDLGDLEVMGQNPTSPFWGLGWDGMRSDSFFSGVLVRWVDNWERVIVARYYC